MKLDKRGLSEVVTIGLIILLAIAAVVIVWSFVRPAITGIGEKATTSANCFEVNVKPTGCAVAAGTATVKLQLSTEGQSQVTKVTAIVTDSEGEKAVGVSNAPSVLATADVSVDVSGLSGTGLVVTGAGVIQDSSGNEVTCQESVDKVSC